MVGPVRHRALVAGVLFALVCCCILVAGLWPFGHPPNDVTWLPRQNGVRLGKRATILSVGSLPDGNSGSCSIEMWLRPELSESSSTLLGFYDSEGTVGLSLHQSLSDLRLDNASGHCSPAKMYVNDAFHAGRRIFLTVVSGPAGTAVYLDGVLVRQVSGFRPPTTPCTGNFVVGDSPTENDSWQGEMTGLAIHQTALTPEQVVLNYRSWTSTGSPAGKPSAAYRFSERGGRVIHGQGAAGFDLSIPERYVIVRPRLLEPPWGAYEAEWGYVEDILINIGGFMPFGFTLSAFLSLRRRWSRAGMTAVLAGFLVSLTIETLQSILPTRNSDLTDVITNTLGTWLGVMVYQEWTRRFGASLPPLSSLSPFRK